MDLYSNQDQGFRQNTPKLRPQRSAKLRNAQQQILPTLDTNNTNKRFQPPSSLSSINPITGEEQRLNGYTRSNSDMVKIPFSSFPQSDRATKELFFED